MISGKVGGRKGIEEGGVKRTDVRELPDGGVEELEGAGKSDKFSSMRPLDWPQYSTNTGIVS